jgi:hypothetical protein
MRLKLDSQGVRVTASSVTLGVPVLVVTRLLLGRSDSGGRR